MIQIIIFLAGPVLTAFVYFFINLTSLINKSREFNRITEVLVLEQRLENVVEAGLEENPDDEELATMGANLIANYRLDVMNQFKKEAGAIRCSNSVTH